MNNKSTFSRKALIIIVSTTLVFAVVEATAWLGLRILKSNYRIEYKPMLPTKLSGRHQKALKKFIADEVDHTGFSAELGWTVKPNARATNGKYTSNSKKIRATREYTVKAPNDKIRISTFGDSYTFGMEVANNETWQEQLLLLDENLEILNFGIGGHGPDQALIRYFEEGAEYSSDIVFLGFMTENINRIMSVYRPYYVQQTGFPLTKPRFKVVNDQLKLIPNPHQRLEDYNALLQNPEAVLPKLGKDDFYYQTRYARHPLDVLNTVKLIKMVIFDFKNKFLLQTSIYDIKGNYNQKSEAYSLLLKIFESFYDEAIQRNALPVFLIYPDFSDVIARHSKKGKKYEPLLSWLKDKGYPYIDLSNAMIEYEQDSKIDTYFTKGHGHYSPAGNAASARFIYDYLKAGQLLDKDNIKSNITKYKVQ
jgi:hypothetical protein